MPSITNENNNDCTLPNCSHNFKWIVTVLYHQFGTILLGLLHDGHVVLNPQNYRVMENDVGFVISRSAEKVQTVCDMFTQAETFQRSMMSIDNLVDLYGDIAGDNMREKNSPNKRYENRSPATGRKSPGDSHNCNSDTFPAPRGMSNFEKSMRNERKARQRRGSKKKLFAKSGRELGLKAISQTLKSQRRQYQLISNSVEVRRPKLASGNSIHDIFGSMESNENDREKSVLMESKTIPPRTPKLSTVGEEEEETDTSGTTHTPTPVRVRAWNGSVATSTDTSSTGRPDSPFARAKNSLHHIKSERLLESMLQDSGVSTVETMRTEQDIVLEACPTMRGHIIAAGNPRNMLYFLSRLRSKGLRRLRRIVVLCSDARDWKLLSIFPRTYLVRGSAITFADLDRVGIKHAHHIVFFGDDRDQFGAATFQDAQDLTSDLAHLMSHVQAGKHFIPTRGSDDQVCRLISRSLGSVLICYSSFSNISLDVTLYVLHSFRP